MPRSKRLPAALHASDEARASNSNAPSCMSSGRCKAARLEPPAPPTETKIARLQALPRDNYDELWSIKTVAQKTGLSRASVYRYVARNHFPPQRRIGPGRIAWLASEVVTWMQNRPYPNT